MPEQPNENETPESEQPTGEPSQPTEPDSGTAEAKATAGASDAEKEALRQKLQQTEQRYSQLETAVNQYLMQQQNQQAQNAQPSEPEPVDYNDDEWISEPGKAAQRLAQDVQNRTMQQVQQLAGPMLQSQAEAAKSLARNDPSVKDVFSKYGSEVEQMVQSLPPMQRANPQAWIKAAEITRGQHIDEIVNERAQEIAAQARASASEEGSGGAGSPGRPTTDETVEKLKDSSYGRKLLDRYGAQGLRSKFNRDVLSEMGLRSFEEFVDMAADTNVVYNPDSPDKWQNPDLVRQER